MNNKKGISDVVTTVLIVLISIVAVGAVGYFILPIITNSGEKVTQAGACLSASLEVTSCKQGTTGYDVNVHRNVGAANVSTIKLIFGKIDGSTTVQEQPAPEEMGTSIYPVTDVVDVTDVAVSAGILNSKGVPQYCTPSQPVICTIA